MDEEALDGCGATLNPDVVLLDIRMPGHGRHRNRASPQPAAESPPAVVFTTAYDEYAIDAFEANALSAMC